MCISKEGIHPAISASLFTAIIVALLWIANDFYFKQVNPIKSPTELTVTKNDCVRHEIKKVYIRIDNKLKLEIIDTCLEYRK